MEKIVFTNGCFDVLHPGHVDLLTRARALGDRLVVGINSDSSVRGIKGNGRPFLNQSDRKVLLEALSAVDEVHIFDENTPAELIRAIKPDVLVKGGDWPVSEIVGADFVLENGGEVFSLPLLPGFSSTAIVGRIQAAAESEVLPEARPADIVNQSLEEHLQTFEKFASENIGEIRGCGQLILDVLAAGGKILICGNGGSAADAQHIAAEFVGRYETERTALPAIALTTDTSALTALANDYDFERVFSRQVEALARKGDLLIAISTSGNSPNIIAAVMKARGLGCLVLGMTGAGGKKLASLSDKALMVPSLRTARIQEAHITAAHIWCEMVDAHFSAS